MINLLHDLYQRHAIFQSLNYYLLKSVLIVHVLLIMNRNIEVTFSETLYRRQYECKYDDEWHRFMNFDEISLMPYIDDVTEEMLAQYLDFLHNELKLAPTTAWSVLAK